MDLMGGLIGWFGRIGRAIGEWASEPGAEAGPLGASVWMKETAAPADEDRPTGSPPATLRSPTSEVCAECGLPMRRRETAADRVVTRLRQEKGQRPADERTPLAPHRTTERRKRIDDLFTELLGELDDFADAHALHPGVTMIADHVNAWHDRFREFCKRADAATRPY